VSLAVTSDRIAARAVVGIAALLFACGSAQAEEITGRRLDLKLPERLARGHAHMQIRTGLGFTPGAGSRSEFGMLLQPQLEARSGGFGNLFAVATTTGGVLGRDADAAVAVPVLDTERLTGLKQVYGGWSSGSLLGALGEDALTITAGREAVEDGGGILNWFAGAEACDTGCWLQRRASGFRSLSANLSVGSIHQRVFYATSMESEDAPSYVGMRTAMTGSPLEIASGLAASVREDSVDIGDRHLLGRISASYKFGEVLPWSPVLSGGYDVAWSVPQHGSLRPSALNPGEPGKAVELGLSVQPAATTTLSAGYRAALSEGWVHGIDASAGWRPAGGPTLRLQAQVSAVPSSPARPEETELQGTLDGSLNLSF
jgi:hypothetical protein